MGRALSFSARYEKAIRKLPMNMTFKTTAVQTLMLGHNRQDAHLGSISRMMMKDDRIEFQYIDKSFKNGKFTSMRYWKKIKCNKGDTNNAGNESDRKG